MDGKISNFAQLASVRRYTYTAGKEKGIDVIDCDNGKIRFLLNVTKALDIMQLFHEGQNMSFLSKNAFTAREIDFTNRFEGGMLYTCGLDSVGRREGSDIELHGTFHNNYANVLRCECNEEEIVVEAIVESTALFGKNLVMRRRVSSRIGSSAVVVEDALENKAFAPDEYCILYHINLGYPMLDDGAKIVADISGYDTRTEWSKKNASGMFNITDSIPCNNETCYFLKMNKPEISLINNNVGKKFTVRYSQDTLPCFTEWHSMASGDYALGLEPASTELDNRFALKPIAPGEKVNFKIELSVDKI